MLEVEEKYRVDRMRSAARRAVGMPALGSFILVGLILYGVPREVLDRSVAGGVYILGLTCGFVLCVTSVAAFADRAIGLARRLADLQRLAQGHEQTASLFGVFRPTQEEVDRQLAIRAHKLDQACAIQADFYQKNRHFLGERAEGDRQIVQGELVRQERFLKSEVKGRKVFFYSLFDNISAHGFQYRDGWRPYLTHAGVGPGHPEVREYAQQVRHLLVEPAVKVIDVQ
jgi:hypothetical protein